MHRLLLLLPALATTVAEPDWAQRAAAVKDAIHASFGAYMAHASDFDVLLPAAKTGGDVAGARYALYESLDTLYVAGLADDFDAAVAAIFAGGLRDPLRRGAPAPKRVASVAEYARRVVGGLLGGFEVSGDRRLLYAAAHAAERALDALPDTQDVVVLPPDRSRLVHARTASVRYLLSHWVDDGADCETVGNAGGFGLELRALSRELDDPSFASAADAIFDEIDATWFQDGAKDSARRLPRYPACDSVARSDLTDAATLFGSLLGEQLIGSTHGAARAAALYDWWERGLLEERADVLSRAGDLTFPVTPGGTPAVEAATFGLPGLLALGATHAFRKGNADEDDKRDALALAARRAGQESEIPNFKGSSLGRFPLVLADFWTSDHLSERSRSMDAFSGTRARATLMLKRRRITFVLPRPRASRRPSTRRTRPRAGWRRTPRRSSRATACASRRCDRATTSTRPTRTRCSCSLGRRATRNTATAAGPSSSRSPSAAPSAGPSRGSWTSSATRGGNACRRTSSARR